MSPVPIMPSPRFPLDQIPVLPPPELDQPKLVRPDDLVIRPIRVAGYQHCDVHACTLVSVLARHALEMHHREDIAVVGLDGIDAR